jgi:hypothetical protein
MLTSQALQFFATMLLAATLGADILIFIYLTSRDGVSLVLRSLPRFMVPKGPYEQAMYLFITLIAGWELGGSFLSLTRPSSILGILLIFLFVATILVALKQYDDFQKHKLDQIHTLVVVAIPVPPGSSAHDIVAWLTQIAADYPDHVPAHISVIEKNVTTIKEELGINILADPKVTEI